MVWKRAARVRDGAKERANEDDQERAREDDQERAREDDRISHLPGDVIHHIFSFIDTKFSVQSSLLSSRWKNTWKSHPHLNFEINHSANHASGLRLPDFVHRYLSARNGDAELSTIDFRSNSIRLPLLKEIITYAMSHKTQKLIIEFLGGKQTRRGGFDLSLFRSQFLQQLCLIIDFTFFKNPTLTWHLPALNSLILQDVMFVMCLPNEGTSKSMELFSCFSNLKCLTLIGCRFSAIDAFIIMSRGLEDLTMIDLNQRCEFVISAPKLSSFTYIGMARFSLSATDLHSLEHANFQTLYHRSLQKQPKLVELMINTLHQLSKAKFLTLNSDAVMFLSEFPELLESHRCPFVSLQRLTLLEHKPSSHLTVFTPVMTYFRRSSPLLFIRIELDPAPWTIRYMDRGW